MSPSHGSTPRRARGLLLALGALALGACHSDKITGGRNTPIRWDVRLTTPNASEGGVLLALSGAPIDSVTAAAGTKAIVVARDGSGAQAKAHVVVRGDLRTGVILYAWTTRGAAVPTVALSQVTAPTTNAQRTLAGYTLTLQR